MECRGFASIQTGLAKSGNIMHKASMTYKIPTSRDEAIAQDKNDPLAHAADAFVLPEGVIYLDGHSLGPSSKQALKAVELAAKDEWSNGLIRSWNDADWINLPHTVAAKIARLIGAAADDVIVCDSVSVNLYKLAAAACAALLPPLPPPPPPPPPSVPASSLQAAAAPIAEK